MDSLFDVPLYKNNIDKSKEHILKIDDKEELNINKKCSLYYGDSLDYLTGLDSESVNFVITSPPYANQRKGSYNGVGEFEYVEWFLKYSKEIYRVLSNDGSFVLNIKEHTVDGQKSLYVMKLVIAMVEFQGWRLVDEYIWHKSNAVPGKWNNRFRNAWEHCYHFSKNKKFIMNQDMVKVPISEGTKKRMGSVDKGYAKSVSKTGSRYSANMAYYLDKETAYPTNVLYGSTETTNKKHPAVYPLWIPEWFIKLFSNEGDIVLDPFMGSGTTALACLNLNRVSIGAEYEEKFINIYKDRLVKEYPHIDIEILLK